LLTSIALFVKKQHKITEEKHEELLSVKRNTEALRETPAAGICVKSGNACVLRGGSMAVHSNLAIAQVLRVAVASKR